MTTRSHDLSSPTVTKIIRTQPLCTSEIFIIMHEEVTSALTLRYTRTPKERSNFDTYRFMLSDPEVPVKEKAASDQVSCHKAVVQAVTAVIINRTGR